MQAKLYSADGKEKGTVTLPDSVFGIEVNKPLLHQVITQYLANQRQGTSETKDRSNVSGGGRKPWKQKGTGRARSGSNTSPVWTRGGKAFGPDPRDYSSTIPRKMRKLALKSALTSRAQEEKVLVVDKMEFETPKTKSMAGLISALPLNGRPSLLIIDPQQKNVYLSGRNLKSLRIKPVCEINALDVLRNENIIFGQENLVAKLEEAVAK
jgi:large subunit ribosomal protein L4